MDALLGVLDVGLLASTIRLTSPILLASLGGLLTERAGIFHVGLEGLMLAGAFFAVAGTSLTGNPWVGLGLAVAGRVVLSLVYAVSVVDLGGDAIIAGLALNLLVLGLTTYLVRPVFGVQGSFYDPTMPSLPDIHIAGVEQIPILGTLVSGVLTAGVSRVRAPVRHAGLAVPRPGRRPAASRRRVAGGGRLGGDRGPAHPLPGAAGDGRAVRARRRPALDLDRGAVRRRDDRGAGVHRAGGGDARTGASARGAGGQRPVRLLYALTLRLQGGDVPPQFVAMLPYLTTIAVLVVYAVRERRRLSAARSAIDEVAADASPTPA